VEAQADHLMYTRVNKPILTLQACA